MKKILLMVMVLAAVSCSDYLDVKPKGQFIPQTDEEYATFLNDMLNEMELGLERVIGNAESIRTYECIADNLDANLDTPTSTLPKYAGSSDIMNKYFSVASYPRLYVIIRNCNIVIDAMQMRDTEQARKMTAAALALKGVCYYNLMRDFCEPYDPAAASQQLGLAIEEGFNVEARTVRSDLETTSRYIISLFERSLAYNITDGLYVFTPDVVNAYLAKTHFWVQNWDQALAISEALLAKPQYAPVERAQFENMIQTETNNAGIVFKSYTVPNTDGNWFMTSVRGDLATRPVNKTLIDLFAADLNKDIRYTFYFTNKRINRKSIRFCIREAELALMVAECHIHKSAPETAKALAMLNLLRSKRIEGVTDYEMNTLPAVNPNALITVDAKGQTLTPLLSAIFDERRKELYLEGDRWFEMKRNGRPERWVMAGGLKYTTKKYLYTFPVYKPDIDLGYGLVQNEGYVN